MTAKLVWNGKEYWFKGWFLFDKASHRTYLYDSSRDGGAGAPLQFSCMGIYQKEVAIMVASSVNPSPYNVKLQHQARINLMETDESFPLTKFKLSDNRANDGLQPTEFYFSGRFENGRIEMIGKPIEFWPKKWHTTKGTWWNSNGYRNWGRALIKWSGNLTINAMRS